MISRAIKLMLAAAMVLTAWAFPADAQDIFSATTMQFLRQVDADALSLLPVQYDGRTTIMDTLARQELQQMLGDSSAQGLAPAVAWMELHANSGAYLDQPVLYVHEQPMRQALGHAMSPTAAKTLESTRRLLPGSLLRQDSAAMLLLSQRSTMDEMKAAAQVPPLRKAISELGSRPELRIGIDRLSSRFSAFMGEHLPRVVPTAGEWLTPYETMQSQLAAAWQGPSSSASQASPKGPPAAERFMELLQAWRERKAASVNQLVGDLSRAQEQAAGASLPSPTMRKLERSYNSFGHMTWGWIGFAVAFAVLLAAAASPKRANLRRVGLGLAGFCTLALAAGFVVRWILSGRAWYLPPVMNQFEAVTGSALVAAMLSFVLEMIWKRSYFALAACAYAAMALLSGVIFPERMSGSIAALPGILSSPVMAVHVVVIIVGHALVGMTAIVSILYLAAAAVRRLQGRPGDEPVGGAALGGAGPMAGGNEVRQGSADETLAAIDRCNLVVAQLGCWTVIVGTALGAYWADFAWGRWWGWDIKETWALVTALVLLVVLHTRLAMPQRWRAFVTALLCLLACAVMLFNWVVVNFFFTGMHSYG